MKFAAGRLYIEEYLKCANCGLLIYEDKARDAVKHEQKLFCSEWCVTWNDDRAKRIASTSNA